LIYLNEEMAGLLVQLAWLPATLLFFIPDGGWFGSLKPGKA
jgi:hypothetical protein